MLVVTPEGFSFDIYDCLPRRKLNSIETPSPARILCEALKQNEPFLVFNLFSAPVMQ